MNSNVEIKVEYETPTNSTPSPTTENNNNNNNNNATEQPNEVVFDMKNFEQQKSNLISATTSNKIFKIHLYIALASFAINFFIWWWIVWFGFAYPWWVFVANFFIFTLTFQYYLFVSPNKREWYKMFIIWYINLFVLLFFFGLDLFIALQNSLVFVSISRARNSIVNRLHHKEISRRQKEKMVEHSLHMLSLH